MAKLPLTKKEIQFIIEQLQNGQQLPDDLQYKLFPVKQKEYELSYGGKMRKEDILANEDGVFPVPLQIEKKYNKERKSLKKNWQNMLVFGDNLQFLKTLYENKDPLIKDQIKGKIKLIYIDPPFSSDTNYTSKEGQKAFSDKVKDSEFIEFLRRRLIVAEEILANDGSIFVHLDWKKSHYFKIILDEIFGERNFRNSIIWHYGGRMMHNASQFNRKHDVILYYSKSSSNYKFYMPTDEVDFEEYAKSRHEKIHTGKDGRRYLLAPDANMNRTTKQFEEEITSRGRAIDDVWEIRYIRGNAKERTGYPTQKPEELIKRIIESTTDEGDLVIDFFGGSGTTASVAEKMNRRWIVCDIGKLAYYTIQKRLLNIQDSKDVYNKRKDYGKLAKTFVTVNTGFYDLEKVFALKHEEYKNFVMELFEVEPLEAKKISGIDIDGLKKDGFFALIYPYWKFKDAAVDVEYLEDLHSHIGKKIGNRMYVIAPANYVDFISDYYEIEKVRYYFLKVPYQIIKELHNVDFKKFRQPQSKSNVNDLDDAVGFHFIRQPKVKSSIKTRNEQVEISIKEFYSDFTEEETGKDMENYESLAMVLIDINYNGESFEMDNYYFAEDLLSKKVKADESLKSELKKQKNIVISLGKKECGKKLMIIYIDIYGNEFKEVLDIK